MCFSIRELHVNDAQTKPDHKLPALYVLDSIAKNIGSPYTLFLAHKLYSTYMNAYSSVDRPTRRKLDEMLKTWRNPVPGSLDPRPVFPPEVTGRIINALHQSTTRAAQIEQQQQRHEQEMLRRRVAGNSSVMTQWRETPTPPQIAARYLPPQVYSNGQTNSPYPPPNPFADTAQPQYQYHSGPLTSQYPQQSSMATLDSLHYDIEALIRISKEDLILNLNNKEIQTKLKALLDLQQVLRSQQLPPSALQAVRDQVRALQMIQPSRPPVHTQTVTPLPIQASLPMAPTLPQSTPYTATAPSQYLPPPPVLAPVISSTNLADLLSSMQRNTPVPASMISTPKISAPALAIAQSYPVAAENPLLAQLRAAGLLSSTSPAIRPPPQVPPSGLINLAELLKSVAPKPSLVSPSAGTQLERVALTSASVKM